MAFEGPDLVVKYKGDKEEPTTYVPRQMIAQYWRDEPKAASK